MVIKLETIMETNNTLNINKAEEELSFIKKIMEDSRKVTLDNGIGFIMWGVISLLGIGLMYISHYARLGINSAYIWVVLFGIGIVHLLYTIRRDQKRDKVKTFAGSILGAVWVSCTVCSLFVLTLPLFMDVEPGRLLLTAIVFICGIGYYVSGFILRYKWIKINAFIWWAVGFLNAAVEFPHSQTLFLCSLLLFFQIIPGMILYSKWKKEYKTNPIV